MGGPSQEITGPNEILIEDIRTAYGLVKPARPSPLRAVPNDVEDDLDLDDSTDEDDEAER